MSPRYRKLIELRFFKEYSYEEIAAKRLLAEEVYNRILAGEDFYTLKAEYSEDSYESEYYR